PTNSVGLGRSFGGVVAAGRVIENEFVRVEVDPVDGTLTIDADGVRLTGANRYVDGGDGGDTYNYSPPARDLIVDTPESVSIDVIDDGPVRARLVVTSRYRWPGRAIGDERACSARGDELVDADIRTTLELRAGERFLRVRVDLDNTARDHRLRAHFSLPARVSGSDAECAYAVVHRGLTAEGGPHERGLPTFVSRRFVDCSSAAAAAEEDLGVAILHDGLLEYEVLDDGAEIALTLLRATGYLSRSEPAYRPNPAGPLHSLEGPQLQRPLTLEYAVLPHRGNWEAARVADAADDFLVPLATVRVEPSSAHATRGPVGHDLAVDGAHVSALVRDDTTGALVVRMVNLSSHATTTSIADGDGQPRHGDVVDLTSAPIQPFAGTIDLRPWEIVTVRLHSS
ncbi:MAG: glycoside hydrolase family 38 C-terminal domain-containing protein, partial [Acidimicrobiia bacterium]